MKDEIKDWIRFQCIEEDQTVRRSRTRVARKAACVPLGRKEVDELFRERETIYESLAFLRQHRNTTTGFFGGGELKMKCRADNSWKICRIKEKKIHAMMWEDVRRNKPGLTSRKRSQKETWRSGSFERLPWTRGGSCRCQGCGGPERTYKQVSWALFGADQGRRDEEYTVDLCTKWFLAGGRQQSATASDRREARL